MGGFEGIPVGAVDFFAELQWNNNREWWLAHKDVYESQVRKPMAALAEMLGSEYGTPKLFRPHRDVRFSKDKTPYKTHQGLVIPTRTGMGWYVQISAEGLMIAGGWYACAPDQLARYRAAVNDDAAGETLVGIVNRLDEQGYLVSGNLLATRPRGVSPDHPRLPLMRHRSMVVDADHGVPEWMETGELLARVRADWEAFEPLMSWLSELVGDSEVVREPRRR